MKIKSLIHYIFIGLLLSLANLSFAISIPLCSPPACKSYTVSAATGDGTQIQVNDWGPKSRKPAILFVHGFPHDQYLWLKQISNETLKSNYRLITMDWRGFGLSGKPDSDSGYTMPLMAKDIDAVISTLNLEKVVLVPHSAGGIPVVSYIRDFGTSKVSGLVITDSIVDNIVFASIPASVFQLIGAGAFAGSTNDFMMYNQQFLTLSTAQPLEADLNNFMLSRDLLSPQVPRQALLTALQNGSINLNVLGSTNLKTLIIWGDLDQAILKQAAYDLKANVVPNAQMVIIPGIGHLPMLEDDKAFNKALSIFVDSL